MKSPLATLADLATFGEVIDVRSPAEFADDHIPGAINCPVLDDAERAQVGTLYKQESPFAARKLGAALVARNIARHLEERFIERDKHWRPLIYCWRGGQRSAAMVTVLRAVGWGAFQLEGGYKLYRRSVIEDLAALPKSLHFVSLGGPTGSGKTRILQALRARGEQVLDLEALACHKGSVLGGSPALAQPSQKAFESALVGELRRFDRKRPVFVEAESRRIGRLRLTDELLAQMRAAQCIEIDIPLSARVEFLLSDYANLLASPGWLKERLADLRDLHSRETLEEWCRLVDQQAWDELVRSLLVKHYDPLYRRSQQRHQPQALPPTSLIAGGLSEDAISSLCKEIVGRCASSIGSESCPYTATQSRPPALA